MGQDELEFLKNYYDFFVKKYDDLDDFKEMAKKTLVASDQISSSTLIEFCKSLEIDKEIEKKKSEISKLKLEIDNLEIKRPKKRTVIASITQQPFVGDPCSIPVRTQRNGC